MSELEVKLSVRTDDGKETWTATATLPGFKPTKVVSKGTNSANFSTRAAALAVARNNAKTLGFEGVNVSNADALKKAAKVSTSAKKKAKVVATPVVGTPPTTQS